MEVKKCFENRSREMPQCLRSYDLANGPSLAPSTMLDGSQLPVIPAQGDLMYSSRFQGYSTRERACTRTKNIEK